MDHSNSSKRRYNESEIGGLIQRATELHESAVGESESNLTLNEIEHIAAELGLPPEHLQAAALELDDRRSSEKPFSIWGAPFVTDQTRVVPESMSDEQWEEIVLELTRFSGAPGKTTELGRSRQWMHSVGEGLDGLNFEKTQVTVRPGDNSTSIQIRKNYDGAAILYPAAFAVTSFIALLVLHSLPGVSKIAELAYAGLAGVGSLGAVRGFIAWGAKKHMEKISHLADILRDTLSNSSVSEGLRKNVAQMESEFGSKIDAETGNAILSESGGEILPTPEGSEWETETNPGRDSSSARRERG